MIFSFFKMLASVQVEMDSSKTMHRQHRQGSQSMRQFIITDDDEGPFIHDGIQNYSRLGA